MHDRKISIAKEIGNPKYESRCYCSHCEGHNRFSSSNIDMADASLLPPEQIRALEYPEYYFGGRQTDLRTDNALSSRQPSADMFISGNKKLPKRDFERVLLTSFCEKSFCSRPIRPYASAGALYSVQAFVFPKNVSGYKPASYHLLPKSQKLEKICNVEPSRVEKYFFGDYVAGLVNYDFLIFYAAIFTVPISKYGVRGYRLALLEAGAMFHELSHNIRQFDLSDRVWVGFDDDGLSLTLGVDPRLSWPIICQLIGREE